MSNGLEELQQYKVEMFDRFQFIENQIARLEATLQKEVDGLRTYINDVMQNE